MLRVIDDFVTRDVLARAREVEVGEDLGEPEQRREWLERIQPADFGASSGSDA